MFDTLDNLADFAHHVFITAHAMRERAMLAAFDPARQIDKIAAALIAQRIKRAVAEQAVEALPHAFMTWEVLTRSILKKLVAVLLHLCHQIPSGTVIAVNFDIIIRKVTAPRHCRRVSQIEIHVNTYLVLRQHDFCSILGKCHARTVPANSNLAAF